MISMKEQLLIDSLKVLKKDIEENEYKVEEVIKKLADSNMPLAFEAWEDVLASNKKFIKEDGYTLTSSILYDLENHEDLFKHLKERPKLLEYCFGVSESVFTSLFEKALSAKEFDVADQLLKYMSKNKNINFASEMLNLASDFAYEYKGVFEDESGWYDDDELEQRKTIATKGSEMLLRWSKLIEDKAAQTKLYVHLIDFFQNISNEAKEKILLSAFTMLKSDLQQNAKNIPTIIQQMIPLNLNLAIDMWAYLAEHIDEYDGTPDYRFNTDIMSAIVQHDSFRTVVQTLRSNDAIFALCYEKNSYAHYRNLYRFIEAGEIQLLQRVLQALENSTVLTSDFNNLVEYVADDFNKYYANSLKETDENKSEEIAAVLLHYVNKITDESQKARLVVTLIDYI